MTAVPVPDPGDAPVHILVVEDDPSYRVALEAGLRAEGYEVEPAADGEEGLWRFGQRRPDLVLLDALLPGMPGVDVCRQMRILAAVPVIMVSALSSEVDLVVGLEAGAADYVTKPFHLRELVARIQAVLRRVSPPPHPGVLPSLGKSPQGTIMVAGRLRVDLSRRWVTVGGEPVYLSKREFDLLAYLLSPPGRLRTREELIDELWTGRELADSRTLDTHMRRLRMKLEADPTRPRHLSTVRGVGFRFDIDPGPAAS
ncbi:MAG: response regulator transcription factor [Actinomycetota bacterium]|nr:response regulator transcription factor [Actinomycetota bacterium]